MLGSSARGRSQGVPFGEKSTAETSSRCSESGCGKQFSELTNECKVPEDMQEAFRKVPAFFSLIASEWQK
jgi:hypothetical protein